MEKIVLKPRRTRERKSFKIKSGAIRTDGKYYECVLFLDVRKRNISGVAWGVRFIADNLEILKVMIDEYCGLYPLKSEEIELHWIECKDVFK